jgi:hypothetical protein
VPLDGLALELAEAMLTWDDNGSLDAAARAFRRILAGDARASRLSEEFASTLVASFATALLTYW